MTFAPSAGPLYAADRPASARTYRISMTAVLMVFALTVLAFVGRPADGAAFAVITPPNAAPSALIASIAQADGVLVRQSRYPWLAIAAPRAGQSAAQFRRALNSAGVLLTLHPSVLAGCFTDQNHSSPLKV